MSNTENSNTSSTIASILNIQNITDAVLEKIEDNSPKFSNTVDEVVASNEIVKDAINKSVDMMNNLVHIATSSQNPRFFEAFTELFKSIVTANKEFIETKQIAKSINATPISDSNDPDSPKATFERITMTTAEFAKLVNRTKENPGDGG